MNEPVQEVGIKVVPTLLTTENVNFVWVNFKLNSYKLIDLIIRLLIFCELLFTWNKITSFYVL